MPITSGLNSRFCNLEDRHSGWSHARFQLLMSKLLIGPSRIHVVMTRARRDQFGFVIGLFYWVGSYRLRQFFIVSLYLFEVLIDFRRLVVHFL